MSENHPPARLPAEAYERLPDGLKHELVRHQMQLDRREQYLSWAGLASAFVLAVAFLGCSTWLIANNHGWEGTVLGTFDIVALVAIFVTRSR